MGDMFFPGEKVVKKYLPPRERKDDDNTLTQFGTWMTKNGACWVGTVMFWIYAGPRLFSLLHTVLKAFMANFLEGIVALFFACIVGVFWFFIGAFYFLIAYAIAWAVGWICCKMNEN